MKVVFSAIVFGIVFPLSSLGQSTSPQKEVKSEVNLNTPNVSANGLLLYRNSNFAKEDASLERNGFDIQEAEVAFYADVDPYSRFSLLLGIHPEYESVEGTQQVTQGWVIEPEELYVELTRIPSISVKLGKFKAEFGKHNLLHTHAFPFVEAPLGHLELLGDEGLNDSGVSLAGLLPLPWFSEVTLQHLRGAGENEQFNSPTPGDGVGVAHWRNLWDMSEDLTLEMGLSYAQGTNSFVTQTRLSGVDWTLKWRPTHGGRDRSWILGGEWMNRKVGQLELAEEKVDAYHVWGQYQFAERWSMVARYEKLRAKESADEAINPLTMGNQYATKAAAGVSFKASEFSFYRLEYNETYGLEGPDGKTKEQKFFFQAGFTIGAHPSHTY